MQSCESSVAFFLSPSSPSCFRVTFCFAKDKPKKKTHKKRSSFECGVCVRPYWYKRFVRQDSADEAKLEKLFFNLQIGNESA